MTKTITRKIQFNQSGVLIQSFQQNCFYLLTKKIIGKFNLTYLFVIL